MANKISLVIIVVSLRVLAKRHIAQSDSLIHRSSRKKVRRGCLIMLTAYFDETGHSRDPKANIAGIAGFVASARRWEVFETDWRLLLGKNGLSEYHIRYVLSGFIYGTLLH